MISRSSRIPAMALLSLAVLLPGQAPAQAQRETLPWQRSDPYRPADETAPQPYNGGYAQERPVDPYNPPRRGADDSYRPPPSQGYGNYPAEREPAYAPPPARSGPYADSRPYDGPSRTYGQPYGPPAADGYRDEPGPPPYGSPRRFDDESGDRTYSSSEIVNAGHHFFGSISQGMASAIEYVFKRQGRPNGYILGEDAGGAFVAGLRYGEGVLNTKDAGSRKVYWQGPSLGYDAGAAGSKVMVLVYGLRNTEELFERFGGVEGSAYLIGGVSVHFQTRDHITLAPIRAGIGLRLGASIGYLKYSRRPTWNPF